MSEYLKNQTATLEGLKTNTESDEFKSLPWSLRISILKRNRVLVERIAAMWCGRSCCLSKAEDAEAEYQSWLEEAYPESSDPERDLIENMADLGMVENAPRIISIGVGQKRATEKRTKVPVSGRDDVATA